jgi:primosomal protein N' (replication factor Y)
MYLTTVIPIAPRAPHEGLTYYSSKELVPGSVVRITVGNKKMLGLVVDVSAASKEKARIRKASFLLKKIDGIVRPEPFDPDLMRAMYSIAKHYARPIGSIVNALIPESIREFAFSSLNFLPHIESGIIPDVRIAAASYEERISRYKSLTREAFAKNKSVVFICPTKIEVERLAEHIGKGIPDRVFVLTGGLSSKKILERWTQASLNPYPVVIITTGTFISIYRKDIGLFVVEHESSPHYKHKESPYLDTRTVTEFIARQRDCDLVLGDVYPRIETLHRYFTHAISDVSRPTMRQEYSATVSVIDMRTRSNNEENKIGLFSHEALRAITESLNSKRRTFLFCVRKGYAPFTICRDCGHVYTCVRCDVPMTLYETKDTEQSRIFRCRRCGKTENANTVCSYCRSWRFESYGVGIENVSREVQRLFPNAITFSISRDLTTTPTIAKKVIATWEKTSSGILLGTELALPLLAPRSYGLGVIVSLDTLTFLPDFRMSERVFSIISNLASHAEHSVIVQTRNPDYAAISYAQTGDGIGMYRYEENVRREFGYPPFRIFIKITRRGTKNSVISDLTDLQHKLSGYTTTLYPAFVSKVKNLYIAHLLISIAPSAWPDEQVTSMLRSLPPQYLVSVDPETLL